MKLYLVVFRREALSLHTDLMQQKIESSSPLTTIFVLLDDGLSNFEGGGKDSLSDL